MLEKRKNRSLTKFQKGMTPWNKGMRGTHTHTTASKLKISNAQKGKPKVKGYRHTDDAKRRMSENRSGSKNGSWKGGITPETIRLRHSKEYRIWREAVFKRDNWTCIWCFKKGVELNADHIKPWAYYPELRFAIDNGRTLCVGCHRKTDTYKGRVIKYKQD